MTPISFHSDKIEILVQRCIEKNIPFKRLEDGITLIGDVYYKADPSDTQDCRQ